VDRRCVWATDIGAYVVGSLAGGAKLAPRISPSKTWSGWSAAWLARRRERACGWPSIAATRHAGRDRRGLAVVARRRPLESAAKRRPA
jgi:phosphatidate cytidylyltransferase